jgi:hypothetical protein
MRASGAQSKTQMGDSAEEVLRLLAQPEQRHAPMIFKGMDTPPRETLKPTPPKEIISAEFTIEPIEPEDPLNIVNLFTTGPMLKRTLLTQQNSMVWFVFMTGPYTGVMARGFSAGIQLSNQIEMLGRLDKLHPQDAAQMARTVMRYMIETDITPDDAADTIDLRTNQVEPPVIPWHPREGIWPIKDKLRPVRLELATPLPAQSILCVPASVMDKDPTATDAATLRLNADWVAMGPTTLVRQSDATPEQKLAMLHHQDTVIIKQKLLDIYASLDSTKRTTMSFFYMSLARVAYVTLRREMFQNVDYSPLDTPLVSTQTRNMSIKEQLQAVLLVLGDHMDCPVLLEVLPLDEMANDPQHVGWMLFSPIVDPTAPSTPIAPPTRATILEWLTKAMEVVSFLKTKNTTRNILDFYEQNTDQKPSEDDDSDDENFVDAEEEIDEYYLPVEDADGNLSGTDLTIAGRANKQRRIRAAFSRSKTAVPPRIAARGNYLSMDQTDRKGMKEKDLIDEISLNMNSWPSHWKESPFPDIARKVDLSLIISGAVAIINDSLRHIKSIRQINAEMQQDLISCIIEDRDIEIMLHNDVTTDGFKGAILSESSDDKQGIYTQNQFSSFWDPKQLAKLAKIKRAVDVEMQKKSKEYATEIKKNFTMLYPSEAASIERMSKNFEQIVKGMVTDATNAYYHSTKPRSYLLVQTSDKQTRRVDWIITSRVAALACVMNKITTWASEDANDTDPNEITALFRRIVLGENTTWAEIDRIVSGTARPTMKNELMMIMVDLIRTQVEIEPYHIIRCIKTTKSFWDLLTSITSIFTAMYAKIRGEEGGDILPAIANTGKAAKTIVLDTARFFLSLTSAMISTTISSGIKYSLTLAGLPMKLFGDLAEGLSAYQWISATLNTSLDKFYHKQVAEVDALGADQIGSFVGKFMYGAQKTHEVISHGAAFTANLVSIMANLVGAAGTNEFMQAASVDLGEEVVRAARGEKSDPQGATATNQLTTRIQQASAVIEHTLVAATHMFKVVDVLLEAADSALGTNARRVPVRVIKDATESTPRVLTDDSLFSTKDGAPTQLKTSTSAIAVTTTVGVRIKVEGRSDLLTEEETRQYLSACLENKRAEVENTVVEASFADTLDDYLSARHPETDKTWKQELKAASFKQVKPEESKVTSLQSAGEVYAANTPKDKLKEVEHSLLKDAGMEGAAIKSVLASMTDGHADPATNDIMRHVVEQAILSGEPVTGVVPVAHLCRGSENSCDSFHVGSDAFVSLFGTDKHPQVPIDKKLPPTNTVDQNKKPVNFYVEFHATPQVIYSKPSETCQIQTEKYKSRSDYNYPEKYDKTDPTTVKFSSVPELVYRRCMVDLGLEGLDTADRSNEIIQAISDKCMKTVETAYARNVDEVGSLKRAPFMDDVDETIARIKKSAVEDAAESAKRISDGEAIGDYLYKQTKHKEPPARPSIGAENDRQQMDARNTQAHLDRVLFILQNNIDEKSKKPSGLLQSVLFTTSALQLNDEIAAGLAQLFQVAQNPSDVTLNSLIAGAAQGNNPMTKAVALLLTVLGTEKVRDLFTDHDGTMKKITDINIEDMDKALKSISETNTWGMMKLVCSVCPITTAVIVGVGGLMVGGFAGSAALAFNSGLGMTGATANIGKIIADIVITTGLNYMQKEVTEQARADAFKQMEAMRKMSDTVLKKQAVTFNRQIVDSIQSVIYYDEATTWVHTPVVSMDPTGLWRYIRVVRRRLNIMTTLGYFYALQGAARALVYGEAPLEQFIRAAEHYNAIDQSTGKTISPEQFGFMAKIQLAHLKNNESLYHAAKRIRTVGAVNVAIISAGLSYSEYAQAGGNLWVSLGIGLTRMLVSSALYGYMFHEGNTVLAGATKWAVDKAGKSSKTGHVVEALSGISSNLLAVGVSALMSSTGFYNEFNAVMIPALWGTMIAAADITPKINTIITGDLERMNDIQLRAKFILDQWADRVCYLPGYNTTKNTTEVINLHVTEVKDTVLSAEARAFIDDLLILGVRLGRQLADLYIENDGKYASLSKEWTDHLLNPAALKSDGRVLMAAILPVITYVLKTGIALTRVDAAIDCGIPYWPEVKQGYAMSRWKRGLITGAAYGLGLGAAYMATPVLAAGVTASALSSAGTLSSFLGASSLAGSSLATVGATIASSAAQIGAASGVASVVGNSVRAGIDTLTGKTESMLHWHTNIQAGIYVFPRTADELRAFLALVLFHKKAPNLTHSGIWAGHHRYADLWSQAGVTTKILVSEPTTTLFEYLPRQINLKTYEGYGVQNALEKAAARHKDGKGFNADYMLEVDALIEFCEMVARSRRTGTPEDNQDRIREEVAKVINL